MRRLHSTLLLGLLAGALAAGCSLFREDFPTNGCTDDLDCFRAQGEVCNQQSKQCEVRPDAAPLPDARPRPDAAPLPDADLTPDATPAPDAGAPDAA